MLFSDFLSMGFRVYSKTELWSTTKERLSSLTSPKTKKIKKILLIFFFFTGSKKILWFLPPIHTPPAMNQFTSAVLRFLPTMKYRRVEFLPKKFTWVFPTRVSFRSFLPQLRILWSPFHSFSSFVAVHSPSPFSNICPWRHLYVLAR